MTARGPSSIDLGERLRAGTSRALVPLCPVTASLQLRSAPARETDRALARMIRPNTGGQIAMYRERGGGRGTGAPVERQNAPDAPRDSCRAELLVSVRF